MSIMAWLSKWLRPGRPEHAAPEHAHIGRFEVIRTLGRGVQGTVYLARDPGLDRLVAVKLVSEDHGGEASAGGMHARNLAQLRHPNIVSLYEVGNEDGVAYLVFEYVEGTTLKRELEAAGTFSVPDAYSAMLQVTDAMAYAHAKGILHLDLNPANIMRDKEGRPRVMDFDLSRRANDPAQSDLVVGTLPYMAPECFAAGPLDARTDVYALGRILYVLLTGPPPSSGAQRREADLKLLAHADPSGHFAAIIRRATAANPDNRFPDARAMHDALLAAWKKSHADFAAHEAVVHGTVAFLLKRIQHRGDFPAISKTLSEVNELTSGDEVSIPRLTGIVLRDYALTNRLLRLANSAYYARLGGNAKTVSEAIVLLGIDRVRLACNSLACLGHFIGGRGDRRLKEQVIASFIAGLISRHLAAEAGIKKTEEAFLAGMLLRLGRTLALFYFPEDYDEIERLAAHGAAQSVAARSVLGVSLPELGHAVGEVWHLPPAVLDCMLEGATPDDSVAVRRLRGIVRFANELVEIDARLDPHGSGILARAAQSELRLPGGLPDIIVLLRAAIDKFKAFAPALEVAFADSSCIGRLEQWLAANERRLQPGTEVLADAPVENT